MPAQVRLTEAEAYAFSSLLRRASDRLETYEEQMRSKPIRTAASLSRFASRQTSWSAGSVPIRKRRPDGRRTEGDRRQGWRAPGHPITPSTTARAARYQRRVARSRIRAGLAGAL